MHLVCVAYYVSGFGTMCEMWFSIKFLFLSDQDFSVTWMLDEIACKVVIRKFGPECERSMPCVALGSVS